MSSSDIVCPYHLQLLFFQINIGLVSLRKILIKHQRSFKGYVFKPSGLRVNVFKFYAVVHDWTLVLLMKYEVNLQDL
jgi:hypothetical protein